MADLGCGSGVFTTLVASAGYHCTGLDISTELIEVGRRKYPQIVFLKRRRLPSVPKFWPLITAIRAPFFDGNVFESSGIADSANGGCSDVCVSTVSIVRGRDRRVLQNSQFVATLIDEISSRRRTAC